MAPPSLAPVTSRKIEQSMEENILTPAMNTLNRPSLPSTDNISIQLDPDMTSDPPVQPEQMPGHSTSDLTNEDPLVQNQE